MSVSPAGPNPEPFIAPSAARPGGGLGARLRRWLFWLHLAAGVVAGLFVAVMSATGAAMAFDPQIRALAERATGEVPVPAGASRLPMDALMARVAAARPGVPVGAVLVTADPAAAVRVTLARDEVVHVDPYTGVVQPAAGATTRAVQATLIKWHRYLGGEGERRELGRAITGAANAAFLFLALSGLVLWWPRRWSMRVLRASLWFRRGLTGRARDWNWHNSIGFWSLPVLVVITFSGAMISYRPISNLVYRIAGETPPATAARPNAAPRSSGASATTAPSLDAALTAAQAAAPGWTTMTVRPRPAGQPGAPAVTVKGPPAGPRFASMQLVFDGSGTKVVKAERFAEQGPGRRLRTWLRFLHTGEALGWPGQLVAGLASLGALVLVYTGLAMALRRWRAWRRAATVLAPRAGDLEAA